MQKVLTTLSALVIVPIITFVGLATLTVAPLASASSVNSQSVLNKQGITGQITVGPVSPICGDANPCYAPYQTTMLVLNNAGKVVANFSSDSQGFFSVSLSPGKYTVEQPVGLSRISLPSVAPMDVKVTSGQYTYLPIQFDSGRR